MNKYMQSSLIFTAICISWVIGTPLTSNEASIVSSVDREALYRLTDDIYPTSYDVSLYIDPNDNSGFNGSVTMRVIANVELNEIKLHALEIGIHNIEVYPELEPDNNLFDNHEFALDDTQFLTIKLKSMIQPLQAHIIKIDYNGKYAPDMFGVYISTYTINNIQRYDY